MRDTDKDSFIKFVDLLERTYFDLNKLKLEKELCCTNVDSIVDGKMPDSISMEWYRQVYRSKVDKNNMFLPFLKFLKTERSAIEYSMSKLRMRHTEKQIVKSNSSNKCWIHNSRHTYC